VICDSCGQVLTEDDEIDYTTGQGYSETARGWSRKVKARCPECGHIQYGLYSEFDDIYGDHIDTQYINEDDSD